MNLELKTKLKIILGGMMATIILSALNPFIISGATAQGVFLVVDFLVVVYLWRQFNILRVVMDKKEKVDEKLSNLEKEIDRITKPKV